MSNNKQLFDTSKMSEGQRAAMEATEAARTTDHIETSFVADLFMGSTKVSKLMPFSPDPPTDDEIAFLKKLKVFLNEHCDANEIDSTGEVPQHVLDGLAKLGAFGIKIPKQYGGLGLNQSAYCRACTMIGSHCGNLFALLSVHQSVGVPQPLMLFGTDEQKQTFLPRVAAGEISAFALTEEGVGSDPARMETTATASEDGSHYLLNGEKTWCSNGLKAGVIIVTAKTPITDKNGKKKSPITAFVLDMDTPGIDIICRSHFMGLRALYNGTIQFKDVKIPKENIVMAPGRGLKVALTTLNAGRLSIPAACIGASKRSLKIAREWATQRTQWGQEIGKHGAIAEKLRQIAANTFAMDAILAITCDRVDKDKKADIRLEAAICKMWGTEKLWDSVNHAVQICGGRGYETQQSLSDRGEPAIPLERMLRDSRVNTIFEGSSEIMRLFIMREALDPHLNIGAAAVNTQLSLGTRLKAALKAAPFYLTWLPKQYIPTCIIGPSFPTDTHPQAKKHLRYVARTTRKMARRLFWKMARHGAALEKQQHLLAQFADIGADLFAISACCAHSHHLENSVETIELLDDATYIAKERIAKAFYHIGKNHDTHGYKVAQNLLEEKHIWLEKGMS